MASVNYQRITSKGGLAMRLRLCTLAVVVTCLACAGLSTPAAAQGVVYFFQPTDAQTYNDDANWLDPNNVVFAVPSVGFNELAAIDGGGTAVVSDSPISPGALTIGSTAAGSGTLEVTATGTLNVVAGTVSAATGAINVGVTGSGTVRVMPGGTLTATAALSTGSNANDMIVVGATAASTTPAATLTAGAAGLNGTTQIFPNAVFSTSGNIVFGDTSVYTSEVNSSGAGKINAGSAAVLNGTAKLNFTGVTPTVGGPNYTIIEAATFAGYKFDAVTSNVALPFNQVLVPVEVDAGGGRRQIRVGLEESIVLEVNRDTGLVKFTHPGSGGIAFDSYFIGSGTGSLVAGSFNGLHDKGAFGGNWIETSLTANNIGELKPNTQATYTPGTVTELGNIFDPYSGDFGGASEEDLQFSYSRFSDGAVIPAVVKYTGTKVNNLVLQVDPTGSGDAYLRNTSETTVYVDGYHVASDAGRISTSLWNSLDDQNLQGNDVWVEGLNNTPNLISEFNQSVSAPYLVLAPGAAINLGKLYMGGAQDLELEFTTAGLAGDYNGNGIVDAADFTVWRDTLGSTTDLRANGDDTGASAGKVDAADYAFWKAQFGNTTLPDNVAGVVLYEAYSPGSGSIGLGGSQVPEPTTWIMVFTTLGLCLATRRHHR
jgi:hypothetical protein